MADYSAWDYDDYTTPSVTRHLPERMDVYCACPPDTTARLCGGFEAYCDTCHMEVRPAGPNLHVPTKVQVPLNEAETLIAKRACFATCFEQRETGSCPCTRQGFWRPAFPLPPSESATIPDMSHNLRERIESLRFNRAMPTHRPGTPEAYRQEGEINMLDHVLGMLETEENAEPESKLKLNVGDQVRVNNSHTMWDGKTGVIGSASDVLDWAVRVETDGRTAHPHFNEHELELVETEAEKHGACADCPGCSDSKCSCASCQGRCAL